MPEKTAALTKNDIDVYLLGNWEKTYKNKNRQVLEDFFAFIKERQLSLEEAFTLKVLKKFTKHTHLTGVEIFIRRYSLYLYSQNKIKKAISLPKITYALPKIYEDYLIYLDKVQQASDGRIRDNRRRLNVFHLYLKQQKIKLAAITIKQVDTYLVEAHGSYAPQTRRAYRYYLCSFLSYLYHEKKIIKRDLASLIVTPRYYAQSKPPKFFRPEEIQKLFSSLKVSSARHLRAYAFVHLAYTMGLRPIEIGAISLDDISFSKGELIVRERKNNHPVTLPIPEITLKAIATYLVGGRPKSNNRAVFLSCFYPHPPATATNVITDVRACIKQANLQGSAYRLRHTYAQNLLEGGASYFEIQQMLGHDCIESSKRYLYIHIKLMRKVLFDEDF